MKRLAQFAGILFLLMTVMYIGADLAGWLDEKRINAFFEAQNKYAAAAVLGGLLMVDLFLPLPSSVLMTLCGAICGGWAGFAVALCGSLASAWLGFWLCRRYGRNMFYRLIDNNPTEIDHVENWLNRYGAWCLVLSRSVPMLTEIVSCLCGLGHMTFRRFTVLALLGTVPTCAVYAYAGSQGATFGFGIALVAAFIVPGLGFLALKLVGYGRK